jgi:hypothetical protein
MPTPLLLQRLTQVHRALDSVGIDHAIGGAIALAVHVMEPRFTADIDLNVVADPHHPQKLLDALPHEISIPEDAAETIARDGQIRLVWARPSPATPLDLFWPVDPVFHALVVSRAQEVGFLGQGIKVMTATDLMVFKALFNRSKDWVDIESLVEAGAGDVAEAVDWITRFVGQDSRVERLKVMTQSGLGQ